MARQPGRAVKQPRGNWSDSRRQFIRAAGALVTMPLINCGGGDGGSSPIVATSSGNFKGQISENVSSYLGIPYAQPPLGSLRFQSPKPFVPAIGVANADKFGAANFQTLPAYVTWIYPVPAVQSEDCLTLNVWAPSVAAKAPVIVWLHGGAWRTGATSMQLMNGQALAKLGVVVVTVNFRLGAMGGLSHPDLADRDNGSTANWQLQDQMAALQWVNQNVAAFGGDPDNICLIGQSAGGTSAALMVQNPASRKFIRKVVLVSPGVNAGGFTLTQAAAYTELLATRLNTTPRGLRDIPAATLQTAELTGGNVVPILDQRFCLSDWTRTSWPSEVPVMITSTATEGSFFVDSIDPASGTRLTPPLPADDTQLQAFVTAIFRSASASNQIIGVYRQAAVQDGRSSTAGDLWIEIYSDLLRNYSVRYAGKLAGEGNNIRYGTFAHNLKPPGRGTPHTADIPFLFGTYGLDFYKNKVGAGAAEAQLSTTLMGAVAAFASNAQTVGIGNGLQWPRYVRGTATSVRMGEGDRGDITVGTVPKLEQLAVWDAILGY